MHSGPTMSGACAMPPCDNCATMSVMGVFGSTSFEVYVDDTPHISAMSSNVITIEYLRRLHGFEIGSNGGGNVFALGVQPASWKRKVQPASWVGK